ncbi:hypothetical protein BX666DRAFT_1853113 [Dichotomocladium elegans]|nr:hypothetical protein BX666DRAFT_1853113 [Dichotomocladium elegans]
MSLDIEWGKLDQELAAHVQHFLNRHFKSITKPAFIGDIEVTAFEWGTETPQIEITNITDPFPEFYEPENDDGDASVSEKGHSRIPLYQQDWIDEDTEPSATAAAAPPSVVNSSTQSKSKAAQLHDPSELDFQASMRISYKGDMSMTLLTELRMNYPSMMFMSLPIQLRVRSVEFEATAVVAYIKSMDRVCVSMLEPDQSDMDLNSGPGHDIGLESLLRKVHIESIVGDSQKQVLKNVGKIEKFIVDQLRKMLDDELVFPSYQCVQLD